MIERLLIAGSILELTVQCNVLEKDDLDLHSFEAKLSTRYSGPV